MRRTPDPPTLGRSNGRSATRSAHVMRLRRLLSVVLGKSGSLALFACAGFVACAAPVDLSAVQKYANATASAGTSFEALADDFASTCARTNAAQNALLLGALSTKDVTLIAIPSTSQLEKAATINLTPGPGYVYVAPSPLPSGWLPSEPKALSSGDCDEYRAVSKAWDRANSVVLSYVQALGNLADVDAVPTPNVAPLATPLQQVGVSSTDVEAVGDVISRITKFYAEKQAKDNISTFLQKVNPPMEGAIDALEVVDAAYSQELESELNSISIIYGAFVRQEIHEYQVMVKNYDEAATLSARCGDMAQGKCRSLAARLSRLQGRRMTMAMDIVRRQAATQSALDFINDRRKASVAYGNAVAQILKTHEALYTASQGTASLQDYADIVQSTGAPVLVDLLTLAKVVKE